MKKIIYQFGSLAGWPYVLSSTFRSQGYNSINLIYEDSDKCGTSSGKTNRQLPYDAFINKPSDIKLVKLIKSLFWVLKMVRTASLVHYHGATILPWNLDALIFKLFKIPTFITWGGGDARIISEAVKNNPYFFRYEEPYKDQLIRKKLKRLSKFAVQVITDPEMQIYMKDYFKKVYLFRQPMNLNDLKLSYPSANNNKPVILHIPTHPFVKGTVHINNTLEKLQSEGYQFEREILNSDLTQSQVRQLISECDIYVDELRCGFYGVTALEAAGSGKPTLTFILPSLINQLPSELPFVITHADNIYDQLKKLILDAKLRNEIGIKSRLFVEKFHEANIVVKSLLDIYKENNVVLK